MIKKHTLISIIAAFITVLVFTPLQYMSSKGMATAFSGGGAPLIWFVNVAGLTGHKEIFPLNFAFDFLFYLILGLFFLKKLNPAPIKWLWIIGLVIPVVLYLFLYLSFYTIQFSPFNFDIRFHWYQLAFLA